MPRLPQVEKRVRWRERRGVLPGGDGRAAGWSIDERLELGDQALIAAIKGPAPKIEIIRFGL